MTALIPALISLLQGKMGGGGGGAPRKTPEELQDAHYLKMLQTGQLYDKGQEIPALQLPMTFEQQYKNYLPEQKPQTGGQ